VEEHDFGAAGATQVEELMGDVEPGDNEEDVGAELVAGGLNAFCGEEDSFVGGERLAPFAVAVQRCLLVEREAVVEVEVGDSAAELAEGFDPAGVEVGDAKTMAQDERSGFALPSPPSRGSASIPQALANVAFPFVHGFAHPSGSS
jgi:hypothetical protein